MGRDGPECNLAITEAIADLEVMIKNMNDWPAIEGKLIRCFLMKDVAFT